MGRTRNHSTIARLQQSIKQCESYKNKILNYVESVKNKYLQGAITFCEYEMLLVLEGRTTHEWFEYYNSHIKECERKIKRELNKLKLKKVLFMFSFAVIFSLIIFSMIYFKPFQKEISLEDSSPSQEKSFFVEVFFNVVKNLSELSKKIYTTITGFIVGNEESGYGNIEEKLPSEENISEAPLEDSSPSQEEPSTSEIVEKPILIKEIPNIEIEKNSYVDLKLNDYFSGVDGFYFKQTKDIFTTTYDHTIRIQPEENFVGTRESKIIASNEFGIAESNLFNVKIIETDLKPILTKQIPEIQIEKNSYVDLKLSEYFLNADEFYFKQNKNILSTTSDDTIRIQPEENFVGTRQSKIIAINDYGTIESNLFNMIVSEIVESVNANISKNITTIENVIGNMSVTTTQFEAIIGKPVKWEKHVQLEKSEIVKVILPKDAENITVNKILDSDKTETLLEDSSPSQEEPLNSENKEKKKARFSLTGVVIKENGETEKKSFIKSILNFFKKGFAKITGRVITTEETLEMKEVTIDDRGLEYEIEYETPAPKSSEENIAKGKKIVISGPDEIHYENVLAFSELAKEVSLDKIKLYRTTNDVRELTEFVSYDKNENGLIDYIEWVVPNLSNQSYELEIIIIDAEHLNKKREFVENIYEEVKETDGIVYTIPKNEYIRAYFERELTDKNIIDIYVRNNEPVAIEVYEKDSEVVVGNVDVNGEGIYYINLDFSGNQSIFDLKSIGGDIVYDYVHDAAIEKQYFFGVVGGTTTALLDVLQNNMGTGQAIWQSVTDKGATDNVIFIKQYSSEITVTNALVTAGVWCDKAAAEGGDAVKLTMEFYDCGTSSDCSSGLTSICSSAAGAIDCDNGGGGTPELEIGTCTPAGSTTIEADNYIGVKFIASENKNTAKNQIYYNTTNYYSYINFTEDVAFVDSIAPSVNLTYPLNGISDSVASYSFNASVGDNVQVKNVSFFIWNSTGIVNQTDWNINEVNAYEVNSSFTLSRYDNYTWNYFACDNWTTPNCAWNNTNFTLEYYSTPDNTAPNLRIISPLNNSNTSDSGKEVNYTANDAGVGLDECWWSKNGGITNTSLVNCGTNITGQTWDEGLNNITLWANDSGNYVNKSFVRFRVDTIAPPYDSLTNQSLYDNQSLSYDIDATDVGVGLDKFAINSTYSLFTINENSGVLSNSSSLVGQAGNYWFNLSVNDSLGNTNYSILLINVSIPPDTIKPNIRIVYPILNNTNISNTNLNVNYTASDETALDECWYSNDSFAVNYSLTNCETNITTIIWSQGLHTIRVYANDTSNNINSSVISFRIDSVYPLISIIYPVNNTNTTDAGLDVNYTFSEDNVDECWWTDDYGVSNNSLANCGVNITGGSWNEGQNNITVYINDTSNNVNSSLIVFWLDTTVPTFDHSLSNQNVVESNSFEYDINASDNWVGLDKYTINSTYGLFTIDVNNGNLTNSSSLVGQIGNYYFNVSINDSLGNRNTSILYVQVISANSAPNNPSPEINSTDGTNVTTQDLNCFDMITDSDAGNKLNVTVNWYNNSIFYLSMDYNESYVNGTNFSARLDSANTTSGENWNCEIRLYDGTAFSNWINSSNLSVLNSPPNITHVFNESMTDMSNGPNEATSTGVIINFSVYDADGISNLNDNSAQINFTIGGTTRENLSCSNYQSSGDYANYTCNVTMWWWDGSGTWDVIAYIEDNNQSSAMNTSTNFYVGLRTAFSFGPTNLTWPGISPGTSNKTSNDFLILNNTGNDAIAINEIGINATHLLGEDNPSYGLWAGNFSVAPFTGVEGGECNSSATTMNNATYTNVTGALLPIGNYTKNNGEGQEDLYFCLRTVGQGLINQAYSTSNQGAWTIRILLVVAVPKGKRRKKKLKKNKIENLTIPSAIFTDKLGCLETMCKYMKDNLNMNYHEIAEILNRDDRTIWTAYKKAIKKEPETINLEKTLMMLPLIKIEKTFIVLPVSIFENKNLTILESIIVYLREKGLKYNEIAKLVNRDQRNIWTICAKAIKKI